MAQIPDSTQQPSSSEIKLKPKGKLFNANKWTLLAAVPFLIVIAIYSSGHKASFGLSAMATGLVIGACLVAWLRLTHTVTLGPNYVKVRNGWRIYTFDQSSQLTALRVRDETADTSVLFLGRGRQKAMINTLSNEQVDQVIQLLAVTPEETEGFNGDFDRKSVSDASRNALPFWVRHPAILGTLIALVILVLVIIGVILYFIITDQPL